MLENDLRAVAGLKGGFSDIPRLSHAVADERMSKAVIGQLKFNFATDRPNPVNRHIRTKPSLALGQSLNQVIAAEERGIKRRAGVFFFALVTRTNARSRFTSSQACSCTSDRRIPQKPEKNERSQIFDIQLPNVVKELAECRSGDDADLSIGFLCGLGLFGFSQRFSRQVALLSRPTPQGNNPFSGRVSTYRMRIPRFEPC